MDSSVSLKDQIWFLRVCHHISNVLYELTATAADRHNHYKPCTNLHINRNNTTVGFFHCPKISSLFLHRQFMDLTAHYFTNTWNSYILIFSTGIWTTNALGSGATDPAVCISVNPMYIQRLTQKLFPCIQNSLCNRYKVLGWQTFLR